MMRLESFQAGVDTALNMHSITTTNTCREDVESKWGKYIAAEQCTGLHLRVDNVEKKH